MSEDVQKKLGTILDETAQRDACHVALYPMQAGETLCPGHDIGPAYGTKTTAMCKPRKYGGKPIGIVDPLLQNAVEKGQWFYCWLFPGTVTGLRHHYYHPALDGPSPPPASESEAWLRSFADRWNVDYDEMIAGALNEEGGYVTARGIDLHGLVELQLGDKDRFWKHVEAITGRKFDKEHRARIEWYCSC